MGDIVNLYEKIQGFEHINVQFAIRKKVIDDIPVASIEPVKNGVTESQNDNSTPVPMSYPSHPISTILKGTKSTDKKTDSRLKKWTSQMEQFLKDNYKKRSIADIAQELGVCPTTIRYHLDKLIHNKELEERFFTEESLS
jgi:DNA-binding NarL/FixJ family response regulator